MTEVQVKNGWRGPRPFGLWQGRGGVVAPAGTVLQTDSVEKLPKGTAGKPATTAWYLVKAHEEG